MSAIYVIVIALGLYVLTDWNEDEKVHEWFMRIALCIVAAWVAYVLLVSLPFFGWDGTPEPHM